MVEDFVHYWRTEPSLYTIPFPMLSLHFTFLFMFLLFVFLYHVARRACLSEYIYLLLALTVPKSDCKLPCMNTNVVISKPELNWCIICIDLLPSGLTYT